VKVWDGQTGQEVLTLEGHTQWVGSVCFSPDGKRLASASADKKVKLWDALTGQEILTFEGHTQPVSCVCFSPDGKRLASASLDQTVRVWDADTGLEVLSPLTRHTKGATSVCFSSDGKRLASVSQDGTASVWDAQTGQGVLGIGGDYIADRSVCFSPDGKYLASAGGDQKLPRELVVLDADTGQSVLSLKVNTAGIHSVCFSPDGKRLAGVFQDNTVKVWDVSLSTAVRAAQEQREQERRGHVAAKQERQTVNVKQLVLAMVNYADAENGQMAPAIFTDKTGKSLLSWRVHILPYIEQQNLYQQFHLDEPWDSAHNKKLLARMPKAFASSSHPELAREGKTTYLLPVGKNVLFSGTSRPRYPASIPDGTSNTILIVEADAERAVPLTKPEDLPIDLDNPSKGLADHPGKGFLFGMGDGKVRFGRSKVSKETLRAAFTPAAGDILGSDW
jgi:uncharacterized protein with WD repeat